LARAETHRTEPAADERTPAPGLDFRHGAGILSVSHGHYNNKGSDHGTTPAGEK
jgi:hypothetical protein